MHRAGKALRSFESAFDERLVDDYFRCDIRQLTSLPRVHLLAHGLEVALHSIHPDRNAIDQRERLRVFRDHRRKHARDNVAKLKLSTALTGDPFIPGPPAMFPIYRTLGFK